MTKREKRVQRAWRKFCRKLVTGKRVKGFPKSLKSLG